MKNTFKDGILGKIKKENIEPLPKSYFINKQRILWIIIGIFLFFAMFLGGFLFDNTTEFFGMQEYGQRGWSYFFFPNIVWLLLLLVLIFFGIKRLKDTTVGHRNPYWKDILIGIVIIFVGSFILRGIGIGPMIHTFIARDIPIISNTLYKGSFWHNPENGRLAGDILQIDPVKMEFRDINGQIWKIHIEKAFISPFVERKQNEKIRILGHKTSSASFEAEKIIHWFGGGMKSHKWFSEGRGTIW